MNLGLTLTQAALKWPDKVGLVFEGRRWTFRQWNREVNKAAHAFAARGVQHLVSEYGAIGAANLLIEMTHQVLAGVDPFEVAQRLRRVSPPPR